MSKPNISPIRARDQISTRLSASRHSVEFYESESHLYTQVCKFLAAGFRNQNPIVVIATPEHRAAFSEHLKLQGFDVEKAVEYGQFVQLDALETLGKFMDGDLPDGDRFVEEVGSVIEEAQTRTGCKVFAYGEMVDLLWREGKQEATIRLEELWNELSKQYTLDLLCGYSSIGFVGEEHRPQFEVICGAHSEVSLIERNEDRIHDVTLLERRAFALESEVLHRREAEKTLLRALDERRESEEKLRRTEQELRDFVENAVEGLNWVGADGQVLWANQAELDLLGCERDEYVGRHISDFHADEDVIQDILNRLAKRETLHNYEARLRCKDGSIRHVLINSNGLWQNDQLIRSQWFTRDISALKQAEQLQSVLTAIVESANDAIVSKTLDGIVTSWNPGAEKLFGYSAAEMIGKSILTLIPPELPEEEPRIIEKIRRGERIEHYETQRLRKDGSLIDISLTISPVKDNKGRIVGASKVARDITERKRFESERHQLLVSEQTARAEAEAANRIKDDFLATLSHELRTPLNAILGWTTILNSHRDEELVGRAIEVIHRNAEIQKRVIEDLLDMTRILSGKMVINSETVDLGLVLKAAMETVRPAALAKTVDLELKVSECGSIVGDADRIQQIVWNLLSNAVKFTPSGGRVQVRAQRAGDKIEVIVSDNGQGIRPDFLPFVFDRFRQAEQGMNRQHDGLGIGLALVRYLTEAHGGTVSVESPGIGLGATFVIRFPTIRS